MKIQMLTTSAGPDGVLLADGQYDVADEQAKELIEGGFARAVGADGKPAPVEKKPPKRS